MNETGLLIWSYIAPMLVLVVLLLFIWFFFFGVMYFFDLLSNEIDKAIEITDKYINEKEKSND